MVSSFIPLVVHEVFRPPKINRLFLKKMIQCEKNWSIRVATYHHASGKHFENILSWKSMKIFGNNIINLKLIRVYLCTCTCIHSVQMFKTFVQSQIFIQSLNFEILKIRQKNTSDFVCYNNSVQLKINKATQPLCQLKHSFWTHFWTSRWRQIENFDFFESWYI